MVMTLVFPDSLSHSSLRTAPLADHIFLPANSSVSHLPTTWNPLSPISQDTALAFAVPSTEASEFLASVQEISYRPDVQEDEVPYNAVPMRQPNTWIVKAAKNSRNPAQATMGVSATNTWTSFVDLIKVCLVFPTMPFMLRS